MKTALFFLIISLGLPNSFVKAENNNGLEIIIHDPFQKPEFVKPSSKPKAVDQPSRSSWTPHLIMTLRAGKNSMANVGGQIVKLGEKIDGYKLIEVNEREVVFVKQGKITRLTLDEAYDKKTILDTL